MPLIRTINNKADFSGILESSIYSSDSSGHDASRAATAAPMMPLLMVGPMTKELWVHEPTTGQGRRNEAPNRPTEETDNLTVRARSRGQ